MPLAELAPLTAERWDIYTDDDEVGQVGRLVGYGRHRDRDHRALDRRQPGRSLATSTGTDTNYEVVRFTITGNPTGGFFFPRLTGQVPPAQPAVPFDTDAATLAAALDALPGVSQVAGPAGRGHGLRRRRGQRGQPARRVVRGRCSAGPRPPTTACRT